MAQSRTEGRVFFMAIVGEKGPRDRQLGTFAGIIHCMNNGLQERNALQMIHYK
jgi:hypothetical protein